MGRFSFLATILFTTLSFAQTDPGSVVPRIIYGPTIGACFQNLNVDTQLSTTVADTSASGQPNLYLTAVTNLAAADTVVVDPATSSVEACTISSVHAAVNEVVTITWPVIPTTGVYKLTFGAQESASIAFDASAGTTQTAWRGLSTVDDAGTVTGTASPAGSTIITFLGADAGHDQGAITVTSNTTGQTPVVTETVKGHASYPVCSANLSHSHAATAVAKSSNRIGPLSLGSYYSIYAFDTSGVFTAVRCLMGPTTVLSDALVPSSGTTVNGEIIAPNSKEIWEAITNNLYLSCIPASDNARVNACPKR